jgi:TolB-like protein
VVADGQHTIAVLRFDEILPTAAGEGYFARGFVEDVITELSRFAPLHVIHSTSSFAVSDETDDAAVGRELDAEYLLRGSVRREQDALRVTARLAEAASGRQLWAERYDAPLAELGRIRDEIAASVASALALSIDEARLGRARREPLSDLQVYDCWLRGMDALRRGTAADDAQARELFERALELDPDYARAHAGVSLSHFNEWSCQAWEHWDEKERLAFEAARRAADLDDGDHVIQLILGRVHLYRREFERAARHLDKALALNPNDADALMQIAMSKSFLGEHDTAFELVARAMRLNPLHPDWYFGFGALPYFFARRYEEGIPMALKAWGATVDLSAFIAAAYAHLGNDAEAARYLAVFLDDFREKITFGREPEPGEPLRWILHVNPFRNEDDARELEEGLRLAGLVDDPDLSRAATPATPGTGPVFRRDGDLWTFSFRDRSVQLSHVKGFRDLAELLARPGTPLHCLVLAGRSESDGGEALLDERARREIEARIRALQEELDEAESHNDVGRAAKAGAELDALVEQLGRALGLGGRSRRLGSAAERARSTVTWRIRSAIKKLAAAHDELGRHLDNAVKTGTFCVYEPETPVDWAL